MKSRFKRKADAKLYGQRSQSETTNSMMKRNLGESLRSLRPHRRKQLVVPPWGVLVAMLV
jgi:hypothetical protein